MISSSHLNKFTYLAIFITALIFNTSTSFAAVDIWEKKEKKIDQNNENDNQKDITIESPIISEDINKIIIKIDEDEIVDSNESVIGIFDPEENNFNLNMWATTDGDDIKKILGRINKLKLSEVSEDLLFQVLFTNAYPPKKNLNSSEFKKIKINWLIKNKRIKDLENLLKNNPEVGRDAKAITYLVNEHLSLGDIKSACNKINFLNQKV